MGTTQEARGQSLAAHANVGELVATVENMQIPLIPGGFRLEVLSVSWLICHNADAISTMRRRMMKNEQRREAFKARQAAKTLTAEQAMAMLEAAARDQRNVLLPDDVNDLLTMVEMIRAGELKCAFRHANKLDTIVREEIPCAVWVWLGGDLIHG